MSYVVRPEAVRASGRQSRGVDASIVLVGCGGTGAFLAEAIARLLLDRNALLFLVDPDRVGTENLRRQAFTSDDLGKFKAEVLAERLVRSHACEVGYSVVPYDARVHAAAFDRPTRLGLVIGAVDNAMGRRAIAETLDGHGARPLGWGSPPPVFWLDAGNGYNSGQVLLGNALRGEQLRGAFDASSGVCRALPAPSLQRPDLLEIPPAADPPDLLPCAVAVSRHQQSATINQMMAALVASYVERLLHGRCTWMASYVDIENGTLQCVPADPRRVASMVGLHVNALLVRGRHQVPHDNRP